MDDNFVQEILHDLFSSMEALETQSTAILQFLKDKGIVTDGELASHLEQAGNASSVRWRGVRVRADYLFSSAVKAAEQAAQKESLMPSETEHDSNPDKKQSDKKETAKSAQQVDTNNKPASDQPESEQSQNHKSEGVEVNAGLEQVGLEQRDGQKVNQNAEHEIEQDVEHVRNQPDDVNNNSNNRPRKSDTEQAA